MHRRRNELALDALEMIEPLDRAVELRAFLFVELGFHVGNRVGEFGAVQFIQREMATSASIVRPLSDTSARPPSTMIF
jgi:hypothetical protein